MTIPEVELSTAPRPAANTSFQDSFSEDVWRSTYKDHKDNTVDDTFWRVARAIASVEETPELQSTWAKNFYDMMTNFKVVPGGRILANAGTEFKGTTLLNCFVLPNPKHDMDSIEGILEYLRYQSLTLKSEGGAGACANFCRPRGAFIQGIGVETPGSVKFFELFDKSSEIITSGSGLKSTNKKAKGKIRKGAQMLSLSCYHPDIIEFITAKQTAGRLSKFNMSVDCPDAFMDKVTLVNMLKQKGAPQSEIDAITWDLIFPDTNDSHYKKEWFGDFEGWISKRYPMKVYQTVKVEWLWNLITQSTYNRNEPGILFLDRANKFNPLVYAEKVATTNPCLTGETLVATADGRGNVPIQVLAEEGNDVPVYCFDDKGDLAIRIMRNPRLTGTNMPIYKVLLDDGNAIQATANHKFRLHSGEYRAVEDLLVGDSLKLFTKYQSSLSSVLPNGKSNLNYWWLNSGWSKNVAEHRAIASFHNNVELLSDQVVHHKDFNGLNNDPGNLFIMSKTEHDTLHLERMIGDNNPMRRAVFEWSTEKWNDYREKQSKNNKGERNRNYSGISNEQLKKEAITLTKQLGHRFSNLEWIAYASEHDLPQQFSKWRNDHLDGMIGLSKWAAMQCGLENIDENPRLQKTLMKYLAMGYNCSILNHQVVFHKKCECCEESFVTYNREVAYCSLSCSSTAKMRNSSIKERCRIGAEAYYKNRKSKIREQQTKVYSDLRFVLGREPMKKEWVIACKKANVSSEISRKSSPFTSYEELKEVSKDYNHKIVSIEFAGYADVYNGTVDEYHNFCIGGFESKTKSGKVKYSYVNNLNCGEQMLAPGGCCDLGTLNLTQFINKNRTGFDLGKIKKYTSYLVRFLDNVNEYSDAPLPEYLFAMRNKRRIGCGLMGWGSSLLMLKVRFGSAKANQLQTELLRTFTLAGVEASLELADEKGMFSLCQPEKHAQSPYWNNIALPKNLLDRISKTGIRNAALFSNQPNGNGSVFANIVSGGIEPLFLPEYIRTVIVGVTPDYIKDVTPNWSVGEWAETSMFKFAQEGDEKILRGVAPDGTVYKIDKNRGLTKEVLCQDYGVRYLASKGEWNSKADWAVTTTDLSVEDHINDLKGFAKSADSACSKTVNLPNDYSFEDFQNIYLDAYNTGYIKGLTTYRAGSMTSVLSASEQKDDANDEEVILQDVIMTDSSKAEVKVLKDFEGGTSRKWYVTLTFNENNAPVGLFVQTNALEKSITANDAVDNLIELARVKGIPEKFIQSTLDKCHNDSNSTKIARALGLLLRHGVRIKNIVATLDKVDGVTFSSFIFHLKKLLGSYIKDNEIVNGEICVNCGGKLIYESGCKKCIQCGNSACS